jgi:preprotein translocase subunit SecG
MFTFLLAVHAIIAAALVTVILMQRSEGGGLGMGGSPSGLMSARGAADFLTRATTVLATMFVGMSIILAFYAASRRTQAIDTSLVRSAPAAQNDAVPNTPADAAPFQGAAAAAAAGNAAAPATASDSSVPLQK